MSLAIGETGALITERGDTILFGGTAILVDEGDAESGFRETELFSISTNSKVFNQDYPVVGCAVAAEIDIQMINPLTELPKMARIAPFVRVTDGERYSEWIQKGEFFIDTRSVTRNDNGLDVLTIHGYDAMLKFEKNYPDDSGNDYPLLDIDMVRHIAEAEGVKVDERTVELMDCEYMFPLPVGYSSREMLGIIAASYGGNFIMSDVGELLLLKLGNLPEETNYLIDQGGNVLVFGEDQDETQVYSGAIASFDYYGGADDSSSPIKLLIGRNNIWVDIADVTTVELKIETEAVKILV